MYIDIEYTGETLCKVKLNTGEVIDAVCYVKIPATVDKKYYSEYPYQEYSNEKKGLPEVEYPDEYIEVKPNGSREEGTNEIVEILEVYDDSDLEIEELGEVEPDDYSHS